jgi:hypothetical protein
MATLPQTQAEARDLLKQQLNVLAAQYEQAKQAGTLTRQQDLQFRQQAADLNKQLSAASAGTARSVGKGLLSGVEQGFQFPMQGAKLAAPLAMFPAQVGQSLLNLMYGRTVNEPQSQEQLVPFRAGQATGSLATSLLTPGNTARSLATAAGLSAADIAIESQGGPQSLASGAYLLQLLGRGGWKGMKAWREGRKFDDLIKNLPEDMPDLERNALKRFMLTGQGVDNGIVAAAMQRLETKPQFAEMLKKLREGATEQTLSGMRPDVGKLTKEEAATGLVQTVKNKLEGLKETVSSSVFSPKSISLYDKAKGYGGDRGIVDPTNTVNNIDGLIKQYSEKDSDSAKRAVEVLTAMKDKLTAQRMVDPTQAAMLSAGGIPETTNKLTVSRVQGMLSEWGKKASAGDTIIKDLAVSDEQRISSAIFGGLKDDIRASIGLSTDSKDKAALRLLEEARDRTSTAATKYNDAVAQGLPAFLKDKNPSSLSFDKLVPEYEKLDKNQRVLVRQWVGDTDPEVLKQFDRQVYTNFLDKARDNSGAVDLGKLTSLWNSTKQVDRDAVTTALGVNAAEFNARMRDATAFNNRVRVAQAAAEPSAINEAAPSAARLAGAAVGYGAHQGVMLSADVAKQLLDKTKLSDEQLMKLLLTPEGADFLRTQKMTPGSVKLLEDLTKVTTLPTPPAVTVQQIGTQVAPYSQEATIGVKNMAVDLGNSILGTQPVELPAFNMVDVPEEQPVTPPIPQQEEQQQQQLPAFKMVD